MYRPELVTPPAEMPVSLIEAKMQCRVISAEDEVYTVEDNRITAYLISAVAYLDAYTGILGRCLVTQTWKQEYNEFCRYMRLPLLAESITTITHRDTAGQISTVNADDYELQHDARGSYVRFKDDFAYPGDLYQTKAVAITFEAGYGAAADVPAPIKHAILLLVTHWYENRAAVGADTAAIPFGVDALIAPFRLTSV